MLDQDQIAFGHRILESCEVRWKVDNQRAAEILYDISYIKTIWKWVNVDEFLRRYLNKEY